MNIEYATQFWNKRRNERHGDVERLRLSQFELACEAMRDISLMDEFISTLNVIVQDNEAERAMKDARVNKKLNATDFVAALERLIKNPRISKQDLDDAELDRRILIDYLLSTDPRKGLYTQGEQ